MTTEENRFTVASRIQDPRARHDAYQRLYRPEEREAVYFPRWLSWRSREKWRWALDELRGTRQAARREVLVNGYARQHRGRPQLGVVGETWADRGAGYWARRIPYALVWLLIALMMDVLAVECTVMLFLEARLPLALEIAIVPIWWAPAVAYFLKFWRRLELNGTGSQTATTPPFSYGAMRILAPLALPFLAPCIAGTTSAIFLSSLRRNFPGESVAREALRRCEASRTPNRGSGKRR
ncbi:hypothetical protein K7472_04425 [Streptomyces sp. PTM05]|uniref:RDD domain-containing protein n=1 Tax=Streptantibioticus parmotrematis TaxID=2873249 RepID=A0ABS7QLL3_9ACTN|nr:hypothetical protein [Streptantibioticus parmotrematis]MBY8884090.1 hypothetical protein [Streptantibioticus parmotrematis]